MSFNSALVLPLQAHLLVAPPSSFHTTLRGVLLCIAIVFAVIGKIVESSENFGTEMSLSSTLASVSCT
ncbi:hypothetical protein E3P81_02404 [Wallemia ichthyophaga]|uniref:Uncharacterized protein n=1 Tax=Wallemia ichthyophaga TaxID=245174 RepID=A0A4T0IRM6_WALIC|nr:hypothetical protein E3P86_04149 [Wallemia ichthyophaga]TIB31697.1 hypothetical protein E3P85_02128 [Wallemia ichthyophaga]TIB46028.1 hypothetical protein E3P82_02404 [Wallemia ichthyophaga]TIB49766.1 hypothetical protein E3P81_02404 [Wallemia ichthyophaga]TIB52876.1 hypothetical protein E3P80_02405 [Wallemia ichthyophaga]